MRRGDRGDRDDRPDPARMGARLRDALKTVDILTARGMTDRTIPVPAELGVDVRVEVTQVAALVVRVPLAGGGDGPALAAGPGDEIRVEVQGEELRPGPPPGGGFPGGGRPGGGGPGLGGGRGGPGGMRGGPPERVDFHAKLKLAAGTDG